MLKAALSKMAATGDGVIFQCARSYGQCRGYREPDRGDKLLCPSPRAPRIPPGMLFQQSESIPRNMTLSQTNSAGETAIGQEQAYLDMLYGLLDEARDRTDRALRRTHAGGTPGGTFQARIEREVTSVEQGRRLAQLNAVEHGLCFGRTDGDPAVRPDTAAPDAAGQENDAAPSPESA